MPGGVFNYVSGSGDAVGAPLTRHPDVDGVVFTGSREVGWELYKDFSTDFPKPCITELGGKNPTIVTRNADPDKAAEGVARPPPPHPPTRAPPSLAERTRRSSPATPTWTKPSKASPARPSATPDRSALPA